MQTPPRVKQPAHNRADRNTQRFGDLAIRQLSGRVQGKHRPLLRRQRLNRPPQPLGQFTPLQVLSRLDIRGGDGQIAAMLVIITVEWDRQPHLTGSQQIQGPVADNPQKPGLEAGLPLELAQSLECPNETVLDDIEGVLGPPSHPQRHPVGHVAEAIKELTAGLAVTRGGLLDQAELRFVDV